MKIIKDLVQGSSDWHKFRLSHIGASESSAILGMNPYKTAKDLWEEKTGRAFPTQENEHMRRGSELEPVIRKEWEHDTYKKYSTPTAEHSDYSFISASFDGYEESTGEVIEIKTSIYPKLSDCLLTNNIEVLKEKYPQYFVQVQHLMLVSGAKECPIITLDQNNTLNHMLIPRNDDFIDNKLLPAIINFWNEHVLKDIEPDLQDKDYINIEDQEAIKIAQEWLEISETIKALQAKEKVLKQQLADYGDDGNFIVGSVLKATRVQRVGSVDTKKLYKEFNITDEDLKSFRKESIGFYKFTAIN